MSIPHIEINLIISISHIEINFIISIRMRKERRLKCYQMTSDSVTTAKRLVFCRR